MYADFDLVIPADLNGALAALAGDGAPANGGGGTLPIAGGTNMIVDLRARRVSPDRLVSLARVEGLRGIEVGGGKVVMGGGTTMTDILHHPGLAEHAPSLVDQARVFAGQMVRNTATVAGNICCGSPAADTVPPLLSLDAEVELTSAGGSRAVPLSEFFTGFKESVRRPDELVTRVSWPVPPAGSANLFYKLARRQGDAITVVGIAVTLHAEAGTCTTARIALGAVAPRVKRATAAEAMLTGAALTPELIEAAARKASEEAEPIDDIRASADYRRHGVHVLTRRLLTQARDRLS
jgi:carbon-monoxide dehydrogenase medium subunit